MGRAVGLERGGCGEGAREISEGNLAGDNDAGKCCADLYDELDGLSLVSGVVGGCERGLGGKSVDENGERE